MRRGRAGACTVLAAFTLASTAIASPAKASEDRPTREQLGCAVSTLASLVPGGGVVYKTLTKAARAASCPGFLDAIGPSVPFDQWAAACFPQTGNYYACPWAADNDNIDEWLESGLAMNGVVGGHSTPESRLTCIYIVGFEGMFSPSAAQNQAGCTAGWIYVPPPPPPPPPADEPDRVVPHTYEGTGYVCASGGTWGVFLGAWRHFPEDFTAMITPWEQDAARLVLWDQGAPFVVSKSDICSRRPFVGPGFSGGGHVCSDGTIGIHIGALRFFPNAFAADITPWPQDRDGYVTLWDRGVPFAVPRGDVCSCGLGAELALVVPPLLWLHRRRRKPRRGLEEERACASRGASPP